MQTTGFTFEPFYIDIHQQSLQKSSQSITIPSRPFQLLKILAEASPEPVSKEQLSSLLWPDTVVSEWSIARLISDTRILLDDDGEQQKYIKTVRGSGFCMPNVIRHQEKSREEKKNLNLYRLLALGAIIIFISTSLYWKQKEKEELKYSIERISNYQDHSYAAFKAQLQRRQQLANMIEKRLNIKRKRQWEMFFSHYYQQMNAEELFVCAQIRAITDNGLYKNNQAIFDELAMNPDIFTEIALSKKLYQHIEFWLTKYHGVFSKRKDMCLLYVGVEDGIPYPSGVDENVNAWLASH